MLRLRDEKCQLALRLIFMMMAAIEMQIGHSLGYFLMAFRGAFFNTLFIILADSSIFLTGKFILYIIDQKLT